MIEFTCNPFLSNREEFIPKPPVTNFIEQNRPLSAFPNIYQQPLSQENFMAPMYSTLPMYSHNYDPPK